METYRHSGAVPVTGVLLTIGLAGAVATILGIPYAYAVFYIPIIYLNFLLTAAFGFVLGIVVAWTTRLGKIRNGAVAGFLGLTAGVTGLYMAWVGTLLALSRGEIGLIFNPLALFSFMAWLYENGSWGMSENAPVKGIILALIWLVEAGMIVGIALLTARSGIAGKVFCEACNCWANTEEALKRLVPSPSNDDASELIEQGNLTSLKDMILVNQNAGVYYQIDLSVCPRCTSSNYMSFSAVAHTVNDKGEASIEKVPIVEHLQIAETDIPLVRNAGRELTEDEIKKLEAEADVPDDANLGPSNPENDANPE